MHQTQLFSRVAKSNPTHISSDQIIPRWLYLITLDCVDHN